MAATATRAIPWSEPTRLQDRTGRGVVFYGRILPGGSGASMNKEQCITGCCR